MAVFGLVGLLQVWISRDIVVRLLGRDSGIKSLLLATFCGTLLIGPAYLVFPLLMEIRKQGGTLGGRRHRIDQLRCKTTDAPY